MSDEVEEVVEESAKEEALAPLEVKIIKEKEVVVDEDIDYDDFEITEDEKFEVE